MPQTLPIRTCKNPECKQSYPPKTEWQKFCCKQCHNDWHNARYTKWIKAGKAKESLS